MILAINANARLRMLCTAISLGLAPLAQAGTAELAGLAAQQEHQQFVVSYQPGATRAATQLPARLQAAASALGDPSLRLQVLRQTALGAWVVRAERGLDQSEAGMLLRALASGPEIEFAAPDLLMQPTLVPDDPRLGEQWGFGNGPGAMNIRNAWDKAAGEGVVVAVLDTGITRHPDLDANVVPGYDFISSGSMAGDGDGRDADPSDEGDHDGWRGSSWHGTHVAGTVAAVTGNGAGGAGTAFKAKIQPVRVLGRGGGFGSDIADAIVWAAGVPLAGLPENRTPAKVINLSLGRQGTCDSLYRRAVSMATANGATVVVAAGNSNMEVSRFTPANCPGVIAVAATTEAGSRAGFSNYGQGITVSAPGTNILSTHNSGTQGPASPGYAAMNGTSMASPHVAGVVALIQSAVPRPLSPAAVAGVLKDTARPLPGACTGGCGAGIVDAYAAVVKAQGGVSEPDPDPSPEPGATELQPGVPVSLQGRAGQTFAFTFKVPAGMQQLSIVMGGGDGDVDLATRYELAPTDTEFNCRPKGTGTRKSCIRLFPDFGIWHVRVRGTTAFSGVSLTASVR